MSYKYIANKIDNNKIKYHFTVINSNEEISYQQFIDLLKSENKKFLETFTNTLRNAKTDLNSAFFWECLPISQEIIERTFEFVVTKSVSLENINQDYSSFQNEFDKPHDSIVCSFKNLGKDATLIVPIPQRDKDYKNISEFTKNASEEQQKKFWKHAGEKLLEELGRDPKVPKWLSTSGLGVHYLHVRIDSRPKYYSYKEYETFEKLKEETPPLKNPNQKQPLSKDSKFPWAKITIGGVILATAIVFAGLVIKRNKKARKK